MRQTQGSNLSIAIKIKRFTVHFIVLPNFISPLGEQQHCLSNVRQTHCLTKSVVLDFFPEEDPWGLKYIGMISIFSSVEVFLRTIIIYKDFHIWEFPIFFAELNIEGYAPLELASKNGNAEVFCYLLDCGASLKKNKAVDSDMLKQYLDSCVVGNNKNQLHLNLEAFFESTDPYSNRGKRELGKWGTIKRSAAIPRRVSTPNPKSADWIWVWSNSANEQHPLLVTQESRPKTWQ